MGRELGEPQHYYQAVEPAPCVKAALKHRVGEHGAGNLRRGLRVLAPVEVRGEQVRGDCSPGVVQPVPQNRHGAVGGQTKAVRDAGQRPPPRQQAGDTGRAVGVVVQVAYELGVAAEAEVAEPEIGVVNGERGVVVQVYRRPPLR